MEWYYIVLIVIASLVFVSLMVFLIIYLCSLKNKKHMNEQTKNYYLKIIEALGGKDNILDIQVHSSRLSVVVKDNRLLKENLLEGIGIIKSSKKITFVIGEMAQEFATQIKNELLK